MTDRELLELAATAAGFARMKYFDDVPYVSSDLNGELWHAWNPLTDDGDAFRLAVKLDLDVFQAVTYQEVQVVGALKSTVFEGWGSDKYAATRRAIVRAAAEIGQRK